jgi:hypothetical protein
MAKLPEKTWEEQCIAAALQECKDISADEGKKLENALKTKSLDAAALPKPEIKKMATTLLAQIKDGEDENKQS